MTNIGDILYITSNYEIRPSESDVMSFLHQDEVHVLAVELVIASFAICLNSQRLDKPRYAHNTTMPLIVININSQHQTTSSQSSQLFSTVSLTLFVYSLRLSL